MSFRHSERSEETVTMNSTIRIQCHRFYMHLCVSLWFTIPFVMEKRRYTISILSWVVAFLLLALIPGITVAQSRSGTPTEQDCLGAIPVCQPVYTTTNSYTGHGNVYPEIHDGSACPSCMDGEKNDVFYVITVQTAGMLRFKLTPNNAQNDYDWILFNMTNAGCDEIYTNATVLQSSCNSYGVSGNNGPTGINSLLGNNLNCNGPGNTNGPAFNKDLPVQAGETYVLNISNWSSTNQSGYTLDFSASSASIYDNVPPLIDSIQQDISCAGATSLYFRFSENVQCPDVFQHPEKFTLSGSEGFINIEGISSGECATMATNGRGFTLDLASPIGAGSYLLSIVGDIRDLCDNFALYESYPITLTEINAPTATAGNDTSVSNGAIITLHGNAAAGTPPYNFHWEPEGLLVNPNVQQPTTIPLGASVVYSLSVTDNAGCHGLDDVVVTVVGGPLGLTASATPSAICQGAATTLDALASGGSGSYSFSWTSDPPGFTSLLQNPVVYPTTTTLYHVQVFDGFGTSSASVSVTVHPKPLANAGNDASIPFGTNITLNGSATGGSGDYHYQWTSNPPGFSAQLQNPEVINLTQTTLFSLEVTDQIHSCISEPSDVLVTVTGSPLACNPVATPSTICKGNTTHLNPMVGGGSGTYTYAWSSTPPGFTSQIANPEVLPLETTSYNLTVSDGYNLATGATTVHVNPTPIIRLGPPDTTVCIYSAVTLDAENPGANYYWSNGSTEQTIQAVSPGIGFEIQTYSVKVINEYACVDSAEINIIFTFAACTGLDDEGSRGRIMINPNPGSGKLNLTLSGITPPICITISYPNGEVVFYDRADEQTSGEVKRSYDFSTLAKGLYLIKVTGRNQVRTMKFINR